MVDLNMVITTAQLVDLLGSVGCRHCDGELSAAGNESGTLLGIFCPKCLSDDDPAFAALTKWMEDRPLVSVDVSERVV